MADDRTYRVEFTQELDPDEIDEWVRASFIPSEDVVVTDAETGDVVYDDRPETDTPDTTSA